MLDKPGALHLLEPWHQNRRRNEDLICWSGAFPKPFIRSRSSPGPREIN